MSKIYNKTNIEIKAKELLHPLQSNCPDSVWQELNYHLNEDFSGSRNAWTSKLFSPKILVVSLVLLVALTLVLLKVSNIISFASDKPQKPVVVQKPQAVPPPVKKEVAPPPPPPKPVVIDSTHIKDSLAKIAKANVPVNNTPVVQTTQVIPSINTTAKVDSAAIKAYFAKRAFRKHWRDSVAAVRAKQDSIRHGIVRRVAHDSAVKPARFDTTLVP
jgi:hypothetical protein